MKERIKKLAFLFVLSISSISAVSIDMEGIWTYPKEQGMFVNLPTNTLHSYFEVRKAGLYSFKWSLTVEYSKRDPSRKDVETQIFDSVNLGAYQKGQKPLFSKEFPSYLLHEGYRHHFSLIYHYQGYSGSSYRDVKTDTFFYPVRSKSLDLGFEGTIYGDSGSVKLLDPTLKDMSTETYFFEYFGFQQDESDPIANHYDLKRIILKEKDCFGKFLKPAHKEIYIRINKGYEYFKAYGSLENDRGTLYRKIPLELVSHQMSYGGYGVQLAEPVAVSPNLKEVHKLSEKTERDVIVRKLFFPYLTDEHSYFEAQMDFVMTEAGQFGKDTYRWRVNMYKSANIYGGREHSGYYVGEVL